MAQNSKIVKFCMVISILDIYIFKKQYISLDWAKISNVFAVQRWWPRNPKLGKLGHPTGMLKEWAQIDLIPAAKLLPYSNHCGHTPNVTQKRHRVIELQYYFLFSVLDTVLLELVLGNACGKDYHYWHVLTIAYTRIRLEN